MGRELKISSILHTPYSIPANGRGFTLIETLVAITLLVLAIIAPMALTTQSLSSAYYARDQIVAFHLGQEAVESIRHVRDGNILRIAKNDQVNILSGIPSVSGEPFIIDGRSGVMTDCPGSSDDQCPRLTDENGLYGYGSGRETVFRRSVRATSVPNNADEVKIQVTISWQTERLSRTFSISENMYKWVNSGSAL